MTGALAFNFKPSDTHTKVSRQISFFAMVNSNQLQLLAKRISEDFTASHWLLPSARNWLLRWVELRLHKTDLVGVPFPFWSFWYHHPTPRNVSSPSDSGRGTKPMFVIFYPDKATRVLLRKSARSIRVNDFPVHSIAYPALKPVKFLGPSLFGKRK